ncbi:MAG: hypothetical protein ABIE42_08660 [Candidatus Eisenbacteria bacterium]
MTRDAVLAELADAVGATTRDHPVRNDDPANAGLEWRRQAQGGTWNRTSP